MICLPRKLKCYCFLCGWGNVFFCMQERKIYFVSVRTHTADADLLKEQENQPALLDMTEIDVKMVCAV